MVFSTKIQEELEKKARSPKSRCSCPEMKNDQDQMTEERGAVPKTSYAGGKFDPQKMLGEATEKYAELTLTEKQNQGQK